ncbi:MAG: hypothetical protein HFH06_10450 [Lachnospiraceae bacterium]|mgnify:CR=1 FL=1|jgi:hypothetical protein|nr:hypothetical protein [Lachnospiraceae bacterium]
MIRAMLPDEYAKPAQMEDGGILPHYEERVPDAARIPQAAGLYRGTFHYMFHLAHLL